MSENHQPTRRLGSLPVDENSRKNPWESQPAPSVLLAGKVAKLNRGGGRVSGAASDEDIQALWTDRKRFWEAQVAMSSRGAASVWALTAGRWAAIACGAAPRPLLTVFVDTELMTSANSREERREASGVDIVDILWAPKGSRSAKVMVGLKWLAAPNVDIPHCCMSLLNFAFQEFDSERRRMLMQAFADNALDVAATIAGLVAAEGEGLPDEKFDAWARSMEGRSEREPSKDAEDQERMNDLAQLWMELTLAFEKFAGLSAGDSGRWTLDLARAWARQEPAVAKERVEKALAAACGDWDWENAPKKTAPGALTAGERDFCSIVKRAVKVAEAANATLPEEVKKVIDAIEARLGKALSKKSVAKETTTRSANEAEQADCAGKESSLEKSKEAISSNLSKQAEEPQWSKEKRTTREKMLMAALDGLDFEGLRWCLGPGGMSGERLLFAHGRARGGPVNALFTGENGERQELAARALEELERSGLDFLLECKAPGGEQHNNPFVRGFQICEMLPVPDGPLAHALALGQVRSCRMAGMDLSEVEAWRTEAKKAARGSPWGHEENTGEGYFGAVTAAIEQVQMEEYLSAGKAPADKGANAGSPGMNAPRAKRATGRL